MNTIGQSDFRIRSYECGPDGRMTLLSALNYMQEAACDQAAAAGFANADLSREGPRVAWVLTRLHLKMNRFPNQGDTVTVLTWPCGGHMVIAERDFELRAGAETIGVATSEWVLLDLETRKIASIPPRVFALANDERARAIPNHVFTRLRWQNSYVATSSAHLRARRSDIDVNGHVNNVHYVEWALEALPTGHADVNEVEVVYRSETFAGEDIVAEAVATDETSWTTRIAAADGRSHIVARLVGAKTAGA